MSRTWITNRLTNLYSATFPPRWPFAHPGDVPLRDLSASRRTITDSRGDSRSETQVPSEGPSEARLSSDLQSATQVDSEAARRSSTISTRRSRRRLTCGMTRTCGMRPETCEIIKITIGCLVLVGIASGVAVGIDAIYCHGKTCHKWCPSFFLKDKGRECPSHKRRDLSESVVSANRGGTSLPIASVTDPMLPSSSSLSPTRTFDIRTFNESFGDRASDSEYHHDDDNDDEDGGRTSVTCDEQSRLKAFDGVD